MTKKFWLTVVAGVAVLVISGLATGAFVMSSTAERSIRNEKRLEFLEQAKEDKVENERMHNSFEKSIDANKATIEKFKEKQDKQYQFIYEQLLEIKERLPEKK